MKPKRIVLFLVLLMIVGGAISISQLDWTPKDVKVDHFREAYQSELKNLKDLELKLEDEPEIFVEVADEDVSNAMSEVAHSIVDVKSSDEPQETSSVEDEVTSDTKPESTDITSDNDVIDDEVKDDESLQISKDAPEEESSEDINHEDALDVDEDAKPAAEEVQESIKGNEVKDQWVQDAIDENREAINESDLAVGSAIYNRLDTLYLLDLAEDGLTEEEKVEVNSYLDSVLTPDEKAIAWDLYSRYLHLLN